MLSGDTFQPTLSPPAQGEIEPVVFRPRGKGHGGNSGYLSREPHCRAVSSDSLRKHFEVGLAGSAFSPKCDWLAKTSARAKASKLKICSQEPGGGVLDVGRVPNTFLGDLVFPLSQGSTWFVGGFLTIATEMEQRAGCFTQ